MINVLTFLLTALGLFLFWVVAHLIIDLIIGHRDQTERTREDQEHQAYSQRDESAKRDERFRPWRPAK